MERKSKDLESHERIVDATDNIILVNESIPGAVTSPHLEMSSTEFALSHRLILQEVIKHIEEDTDLMNCRSVNRLWKEISLKQFNENVVVEISSADSGLLKFLDDFENGTSFRNFCFHIEENPYLDIYQEGPIYNRDTLPEDRVELDSAVNRLLGILSEGQIQKLAFWSHDSTRDYYPISCVVSILKSQNMIVKLKLCHFFGMDITVEEMRCINLSFPCLKDFSFEFHLLRDDSRKKFTEGEMSMFYCILKGCKESLNNLQIVSLHVNTSKDLLLPSKMGQLCKLTLWYCEPVRKINQTFSRIAVAPNFTMERVLCDESDSEDVSYHEYFP